MVFSSIGCVLVQQMCSKNHNNTELASICTPTYVHIYYAILVLQRNRPQFYSMTQYSCSLRAIGVPNRVEFSFKSFLVKVSMSKGLPLGASDDKFTG